DASNKRPLVSWESYKAVLEQLHFADMPRIAVLIIIPLACRHTKANAHCINHAITCKLKCLIAKACFADTALNEQAIVILAHLKRHSNRLCVLPKHFDTPCAKAFIDALGKSTLMDYIARLVTLPCRGVALNSTPVHINGALFQFY